MFLKKLPLLLALAVAFTFCACDSSTSATSSQEEIDSSTSGEKVPGSSESTSPDNGGKEGSSASKTNPGSTNSSDSKGDNAFEENLTENQAKLVNTLKEFASGNEETKKLTESCQDGEKTSQEIMDQPVEFSCMYETWVPTSGMKELVENMDPTMKTMVLASANMTEEELYAFIDFMENLDPTKNDIGVTCEGEISDNTWHVTVNGIMTGMPVKMEATTSFNGSTMITNQTMTMDFGSEAMCKKILLSNDDEEEDEEDPEYLYGKTISKEESCDGQYYVEKETQTKEITSDSDRAEVYKDMVQSCRDYRDGKITFDELMEY